MSRKYILCTQTNNEDVLCGVENIFCVHTTNNEDVLCGVENIFCVHTTNNEDVLCVVESIFCVHTTNNEDVLCVKIYFVYAQLIMKSWKYNFCTHNQ